MASRTPEPQTSSHVDDDEADIRSLYQQAMDGWNMGNGDAFAASFAEDADLIGFDGTHLKGRSEIASFHQRLFDTFVKGTRLVGKVKSVRFLAPNVSLMHTVGGTVMPGQSDIDPERNSVQTIVATKKRNDGRWRIAAFQNTRAQFMGRPEAAQDLTEELRTLL
jgi:uncharacterized protein (TIGR02246 family)